MQVNAWEIQGDPAAVAQATHQALEQLGYRVTPAEVPNAGRAEVGSAAARVLIGGFARRHKVNFVVQPGPTGVMELQVRPGMSGWSGGAIGKSKANKEHDTVLRAVEAQLVPAGLIGTHQQRNE